MKLNGREWDQAVQKLAAAFGVRRRVAALESADMSAHSKNAATQAYDTLPIGKLSPLQEDESRYYATAIIEKTNARLKVATVSWLKEPFESWRARGKNELPATIAAPSGTYTLPKISEGAAAASMIPGHPPLARPLREAVTRQCGLAVK